MIFGMTSNFLMEGTLHFHVILQDSGSYLSLPNFSDTTVAGKTHYLQVEVEVQIPQMASTDTQVMG